jgi:hypothetical protein
MAQVEVFDNKVLRKLLRPKREKVTTGLKKLNKHELHYLLLY